MPLIDFTREQIPELRKIIRSEINSIINTQNRPSVIDDGHQAPEVYVALVPEDGIPPVNFDGTGTGSFIADTGDSGDVPGSAVCEIYFLDVNLLELKSTGRSETVYNLETLNISGPKWISIHRDKYGRWFAVSSGGVCDVTNEIQHIVIFGQPTRGTFDVSLTLADPDDQTANPGGLTETISINWDDTADEVKIALMEHTQLSDAGTGTGTGSGTGELINDILVMEGPLPSGSIKVEFVGDFSATRIDLMGINIANLTGGLGVGGVVIREQAGRP